MTWSSTWRRPVRRRPARRWRGAPWTGLLRRPTPLDWDDTSWVLLATGRSVPTRAARRARWRRRPATTARLTGCRSASVSRARIAQCVPHQDGLPDEHGAAALTGVDRLLAALNAELIALKIRHHDPAPRIGSPAVIHDASAQRFDSGNFLILRSVMWQEIEVNSILGALGFRYFHEDKSRGGVTIGTDRPEGVAWHLLFGAGPAGDLAPETRHSFSVRTVERHVQDGGSAHSRSSRRVQYIAQRCTGSGAGRAGFGRRALPR